MCVVWPSGEQHLSLGENKEEGDLCCRGGIMSSAHLETRPRSCLQMSDSSLPTSITHTHTHIASTSSVTLDLLLFEG